MKATALALAILSLVGPAAALPPPDLTGTWEVVLQLEGFSRDYLLEVTQSGDTVKSVLVSPRSGNRYPAKDGAWKDSVLRIDISRNILGSDVLVKVAARLAGDSGDRLEGSVEAEGLGSGKFTAVRKTPAPRPAAKKPTVVGKWRTSARLSDDRTIEARLEVTEKEGKLLGVTSSERGSLDLKSIGVADDGAVNFSLVLPSGDGDREYHIRAVFEKPDRLKGRWRAADDSVSGEWTAEREKPPAAARALQGRYRITATIPGEDRRVEVDLHLKVEGEKVTGFLIGSDGKRTEIRSGAFKEGKLEFVAEGESGPVQVRGSLDARGSLIGTYNIGDRSGDWTALPVEEL